jgi:hypothetical protein
MNSWQRSHPFPVEIILRALYDSNIMDPQGGDILKKMRPL